MQTSSREHQRIALSIITVNYSSFSSLARLYQSLPAGFFDRGEMIVVNNDADESRVLARWAKKVRVQLLESGGNVGFGVACNIGAVLARGENILFLNPDTEYRDGDFFEIESFFRKNPDAGACGAPLYERNGEREAWSFGHEPFTMKQWVFNQFRLFPLRRVPPPTVAWVSGAALALPREIFFRLGGFDERFFLYYEDVDLCERVRQSGKRVVMLESPSFWHKKGKSHSSFQSMKQYYFASQDQYIEKHDPGAPLYLFRLLRWMRYGFWV